MNVLVEEVELTTDEATYKQPTDADDGYKGLNRTIYEKVEFWSDAHQRVVEDFESDVLPLVDMMHSILSQRGANHKDGLPEWPVWFADFCARLGKKMTLRTIQRKLRKYRGLPKSSKSPNPAKVIKWSREEIADYVGVMLEIPTEPEYRTDAERLNRMVELVRELQQAVADGLLG